VTANPYEVYRRSNIETSSPGRLVVLCFEAAVRHMGTFSDAVRNRRIEDAHNAAIKAQRIVLELSLALDPEKGGEIAKMLRAAYDRLRYRMVNANLRKNAEEGDAGAFNDNGTGVPADDSLAPWSSRGVTADGFAKPELVAPGVHIVSTLAKKSLLADVAAGSVVQGRYIDLSGTSASAAVVSGAVTLLLQQEPNLTPDQVKFRLLATAGHLEGSAAPRVDAFAATSVHVFGLANQTAQPNDLLNPATGAIAYDSVLWHSVLWHSVLWNSVLWSSIRWSPVWQP